MQRRGSLSPLLVGTALVGALLVAGCSGEDSPDSAPEPPSPTGLVTPTVQPDGSYQLGSLPNAEAAAALKVAVATLPIAVSYDHRSLDESLAKATASMTPRFAAEFRKIFDQTTRPKALKEKAITSALVRGAGVVDPVRDAEVTCLIYLDQVLVASTSKKADSPLKVTQNSVRVKLQKTDGTWKVDGIEPF